MLAIAIASRPRRALDSPGGGLDPRTSNGRASSGAPAVCPPHWLGTIRLARYLVERSGCLGGQDVNYHDAVRKDRTSVASLQAQVEIPDIIVH